MGIRVSPGAQEWSVREALMSMEVTEAIDDVQQVIDYQEMSNFAAGYSSRTSFHRFLKMRPRISIRWCVRPFTHSSVNQLPVFLFSQLPQHCFIETRSQVH